MIARLTGDIVEKRRDKDFLAVVLDVGGVGYEVFLTQASESRLLEGSRATLYISESVTAFDGATTLYGFVSPDEKDFFLRLRENVDGMGPKKALECLDKVSKSLPDFKRAIAEGDSRFLVSIFGFTKKTAEKLVFSLKDKLGSWSVAGDPRWPSTLESPENMEAVSGLVNLGFKEMDAISMVEKARRKLGAAAPTEDILNDVLRMRGATSS